MQQPFELNQLNEVLTKTISAIEDGKKEIFEISEKARSDSKSLEDKLKEIQGRIAKLISDVDVFEIKEKISRQRLLEVSKNFKEFDERDIKKAYETAKDLQVELTLKRQEEKDLIKLRTEVEIRIKDSREVARRADVLTSKVGLALEYLSEAATEKLEDIRQKSEMGIRIIKAQEEERHRVSREIHDGPAQAMANVMIKAEYCEKLIDMEPQKAKTEIKVLKEIVKDNLKNIRRIIYDLMPMSLDDLGLKPTISKLLDDYERETGIETRFIYIEHMPTKLKRVINLTLFRIIQEGLNNVLKHASAKTVIVELVITGEAVEVRIHDNGVGFDPFKSADEAFNTESGFGIYAMRERVELLEGTFEIQSESNKGTKLLVTIPLKNEVLFNE
jgi:two-component system sensor histidine kinase DegS